MDQRSPQDTLAQHSQSDRAMQNLVDHTKVLAADARELMRQAAGQAGERLAGVRSRTLDSLAAVESRLGPLQQALTERARAAAQLSTRHVREHPMSTLFGAAAVVLAIAAVVAWNSESSSEDNLDDR